MCCCFRRGRKWKFRYFLWVFTGNISFGIFINDSDRRDITLHFISTPNYNNIDCQIGGIVRNELL